MNLWNLYLFIFDIVERFLGMVNHIEKSNQNNNFLVTHGFPYPQSFVHDCKVKSEKIFIQVVKKILENSNTLKTDINLKILILKCNSCRACTLQYRPSVLLLLHSGWSLKFYM